MTSGPTVEPAGGGVPVDDPAVGRCDDAVWGVLELVATSQGLDDAPDDRAAPLGAPDFDHGRLVEQAMRHGLLAALADYLHRHGLRRTLPARLRNPVASYLRLSRHRARLLTGAAEQVTRVLVGEGVPAAWTKGVVLQSTLYDGTGVRTFNDIDLMIRPVDRDRIRDVLVAVGYQPATRFDQSTGELRAIGRAAERMYQLSPDHLPHLHLPTDDLIVPAVSLDVANSLTWHGSRWQVPVDQVLERAAPVPVGPATLPALSDVDSFLFLCLHLFREGWIQRTIATKDVSLAQFADIHRQWRRVGAGRHDAIAGAVAGYGLAEPVGWVCGHTDALFGTDLVARLGLTAQVTTAWLASAQGSDGRSLSWSGDMRERLRDPGTPALVRPSDSSAPERQAVRAN